jgi:adenosylhomocysteine nucleosidase
MRSSSSLPKRLAIFVAVAQEAGPIRLRMSELKQLRDLPFYGFEGKIGQTEVWTVVAGMGAGNTSLAAMAVSEKWQPDALLSAGVAGAIDPELQVGEVICATEILYGPKALLPTLKIPATRSGRLLCSDQVLVTAKEKEQAHNRPKHLRALAVEMESAGVAKVAKDLRLPWGALRAISDTAGHDLPLDFNRLRDGNGNLPIGRIILATLARPAAIPGLLKLGSQTTKAANQMADALTAWLDPSK